MKRSRALLCCLGLALALALAPLPGVAQEKNARENLERVLQLAHCLAYYEAAETAQGMDAMDREIAGMGREILDFTLMIEDPDRQLVGDVAKVLGPHVAAIPGDELFDLYDDACDKVME